MVIGGAVGRVRLDCAFKCKENYNNMSLSVNIMRFDLYG